MVTYFPCIPYFHLPHTASAVSTTHPLNSPHALSTSSPVICFALYIWCPNLAQNLTFPSFLLSLSLLSRQLRTFSCLHFVSSTNLHFHQQPGDGHFRFLPTDHSHIMNLPPKVASHQEVVYDGLQPFIWPLPCELVNPFVVKMGIHH